MHHKVQKFSSGTGSPGWSRKKGCKTVVCVCVCCQEAPLHCAPGAQSAILDCLICFEHPVQLTVNKTYLYIEVESFISKAVMYTQAAKYGTAAI